MSPESTERGAVAALAAARIRPAGQVYVARPPAALVEDAIRHAASPAGSKLPPVRLTAEGALAAATGAGSARLTRRIVQDAASAPHVAWGAWNRPLDAAAFDRLEREAAEYLGRLPTLWVQDLTVGDGSAAGLRVRLVSDSPWHVLFATLLWGRPGAQPFEADKADLLVVHAPGRCQDPSTARDADAGAVAAVHLTEGRALVAGTFDPRAIREVVLSFAGYRMPLHGALPLCGGASVDPGGAVALFAGAPGSGALDLAADPRRTLLGTGPIGWDDTGLFRLESGGCAAVRRTSEAAADRAPILRAARGFGSVLTDVDVASEDREVRFDGPSTARDASATFPWAATGLTLGPARATPPRHLFLLARDALGVLPAVAPLTQRQAVDWFTAGYTAETDSTCAVDGSPRPIFANGLAPLRQPLPTVAYARLLADRLRTQRTQVWLLNTGWLGGGPGVGRRIPRAASRAIVDAVLRDQLAPATEAEVGPFRLAAPSHVPDVPGSWLDPVAAWADPAALAVATRRLEALFAAESARHPDEIGEALRVPQFTS